MCPPAVTLDRAPLPPLLGKPSTGPPALWISLHFSLWTARHVGPVFAGRRGGLQEAEQVPALPHPWLVARGPVGKVGLLRPRKDYCEEGRITPAPSPLKM